MSARALKVRATGNVQGVGFRAFTAAEAARRGISGWVRNEEDGSVTAALHGPGAALAELIGRLRQGPPMSKVDGLDVQSAVAGTAAEAPAGAHSF